MNNEVGKKQNELLSTNMQTKLYTAFSFDISLITIQMYL